MGLTQLLNSFSGANDIGQPNAEFLVHHHYLTMGNQRTVYQHIQRLTRQSVQLNYGPLIQLQQVADTDVGAPNLHGKSNRNIQDHIQRGIIGPRSFPCVHTKAECSIPAEAVRYIPAANGRQSHWL